ncbi:axin interactor, dorsalization-associated protein [Elysia marginata]|uniref:Axin interactor, dorsalization-associated protein n=1 Tax=Elysia marginata TaxID=1093978 RepID=A0AAV4FT44_9GAST|nr:axin interactor, dorsalization-associated protein [Elysia marginata]
MSAINAEPLPITGKTLLSIKIIKIDLKDASQYLDPFMTVAVRDSNEIPLSASQDTPVASRKADSEIVFNKMVHIQKAIESLPPGFAIFFEFKHYKPKKRNISTKCWAFIEQDELKEGDLALEM